VKKYKNTTNLSLIFPENEGWLKVTFNKYKKDFSFNIVGIVEFDNDRFIAYIKDELGSLFKIRSFKNAKEAYKWITETGLEKVRSEKTKNPFSESFEDTQDFASGEDIISTINPEFDSPDDIPDDFMLPNKKTDAILYPSGRSYKKIGIKLAGFHIGDFDSLEEAKQFLKSWMNKNNYYPSIWYIDRNGKTFKIKNNPKYAEMDLDELIEEHKKLIQLLKNSTQKERNEEAAEQLKELIEYIKLRVNPTIKKSWKKWKAAEVQSLAFPKGLWSLNEAKKWAKDHNYKYGSVDEAPNFWRLRQIDPSYYDEFRWGEPWPAVQGAIYPIYGGVLKK